MSSFKNFLQTTKVEELGVHGGELIQLCPTQTITSVLSIMFSKGILSAPVYDSDKKTYVGVLDLLDLITCLSEIFNEGELSQLHLTKLPDVPSKRLLEHFRFHQQFVTGCTIDHMAGVSGANPVVPVVTGTSLLEAIQQLVEHKAHRLPVMKDDVTIASYVSQSTILSYIAKNLDKIDQSLLNKTVSSLGLDKTKPVTVNQRDIAVSAFKTMCQNKVSGLPIVDDAGTCIGVISVKDIKGIGSKAQHFETLYIPVVDFISKVRQSDISDTKATTIGVRSTDNLAKVIQRLVATRVHRVVVVDDFGKVKSVISLGDVLSVLLKNVC